MKLICVLLGLAVACHAETYEEFHSKIMPELNAVPKTWTVCQEKGTFKGGQRVNSGLYCRLDSTSTSVARLRSR